MQLGPPLRVRRRLHLRPPPRCFQVRHVASAWTGSPEAISASSLFLILQSILFSELESLWDIISVIWFSTFPSRHRLKTFFFFYSARWNSIKRRDLQTSEPNTFLFHQKNTLLHFRTAWHSTTCQLPSKTSITESKSVLNLTFVVLFQWSNCSRALWKRDSPRGGVSVRLRPAALLQWRCLQPDRLQHFLQVREARH